MFVVVVWWSGREVIGEMSWLAIVVVVGREIVFVYMLCYFVCLRCEDDGDVRRVERSRRERGI